jgi:hypothetical protein
MKLDDHGREDHVAWGYDVDQRHDRNPRHSHGHHGLFLLPKEKVKHMPWRAEP